MRAVSWLTVGIGISGLAFGQLTNRVHGPIENNESFVLAGTIRPALAYAQDQGPAPASHAMPRMSIRFAMTGAQRADLAELLDEQQTRGSAKYHRWLTSAQYADRFGVSQQDVQSVAAWLQNAGFMDVEVAPSRTSVSFSGTAGQASAAFHASIHGYVLNGESHVANATDPVLPKALEGVVESIAGLHDFRPKPQGVRRPAIKSHYTDGATGENFLAPDDFATIYDVKSLYQVGIDGSGQKIAVAGQTDIAVRDIQAFRSAAGLPQKNPQIVLTGPDPGTRSGDEGEADLDVEWAGAIAKNATVIYVNSTNVFTSAVYAIEHNLAPVLSISYGACEAEFSAAEMASFASAFAQGNAQGITTVADSGDRGPADCDSSTATTATHGLAVNAPASLPYATGVGGTTLQENGWNYWAGNNGRGGGSALSYIPEVAWNDTAADGTLWASGGGKSAFFAKPSWQAGDAVPNDGGRDVPDVAFAASPNHDGYLICSGGNCVNGFRNTDSSLDIWGGTSCGTPSMAGIVALLNQMTGQAQGNINPELYTMASILPNAFHDIVGGDNNVPCSQGSLGCYWLGNSGIMGYGANPGYDQVTGIGSIDAFNLVTEWGEPAATALAPMPMEAVTLQAGADGSLWGMGIGGTVFSYNSQMQSWTQVTSGIADIQKIAVGSNSAVWAVAWPDTDYRWDPSSQSFLQTSTAVWSISVGADGDTWGLQSLSFSQTNSVYHFDFTTQAWIPVPGELNQIAVGNSGAVWGINQFEQIYRFNPGTGLFDYVPGALTSISIGADGGVWGVNFGGSSYYFDPLTQRWDQVPGDMFQISAGSGANVWAVTADVGLPYKYDPRTKTWLLHPGQVESVSASADGAAWGVNDDGQIYQLSGSTQATQAWHQVPGALVQLSAASDGNVWGVNRYGQIYTFDPLEQSWIWIPGTLSEIVVAAEGAVWGINPEGSVYRYDYSKAGWDLMSGNLSQIAVADTGDVWGIDAQDSVYRFNAASETWTGIPGSLARLSVGVDGTVWGLDAQSNVYRFDAQSGVFTVMPGVMKQISVGSNANVWALDGQGSIYRFDSGTQNWQNVPGQLVQIRAAFDGSVWGINSDESIFRYNAAAGSWDYTPGSLVSLSLGSDAAVWGINSGGATYYFQ